MASRGSFSSPTRFWLRSERGELPRANHIRPKTSVKAFRYEITKNMVEPLSAIEAEENVCARKSKLGLLIRRENEEVLAGFDEKEKQLLIELLQRVITDLESMADREIL